MTPDVQAAAERLRAFIRVADDGDPIIASTWEQVSDPPRPRVVRHDVTFDDLRTLLAALDPADGATDGAPRLDYHAIRRQQHPRTVRDFRGVAGEPPHSHVDGPR